jgi:hypothetical protein
MKLRSRSKLVFIIVIICAGLAAVAPDKFKAFVDFLTENPSLDKVHALSQGFGLLPPPGIGVTMIRIDDKSFEDWGRPFPFSKTKLATLVMKAKDLGASAILVDLDISAKTDSNDTDALRMLLDEWTADDPPLLFPRELRIGKDGRTSTVAGGEFDGQIAPERSLYWVNVLFEQTGDLKIRNWNLWEVPDGSCEALLAPSLLAFSYMDGNKGRGQVNYVARYLALREKPDCKATIELPVGAMPGWLPGLEKNAPIQFTFPFSDATASSAVLPRTQAPALMQFSAKQYAEREVARSAVEGRFVIIGNSYADNGDFHDTPAGEMEGMRVIANAVANAPNAITESMPWREPAVLLFSVLLGGLVAFLTLMLKPLASGPTALLVAIAVYSVCNQNWGPVAAHEVVVTAVAIWVLVIALESLEAILRGLIVKRRGWRSFLNE